MPWRDSYDEVTTRLSVLLDAAPDPDWVTAGLCGIHPSSLSRYRAGTRSMPMKHAQVLAAHLGVELDDVRGQANDVWLEELVSRQEEAAPGRLSPSSR